MFCRPSYVFWSASAPAHLEWYASRRAGRIARITARILFVPVAEAVAIAVDGESTARARRGTGIGQLLPSHGSAAAQCRVSEWRVVVPIAEEDAAAVEEADLPVVVRPTIHHQVALAHVGACP